MGTLKKMLTVAGIVVLFLLAGCSSMKLHRHIVWLCGAIDGKPLRVAIDDQLYIKTEAATIIDLHPCSKAERKAKIHG